MMRKIAFGIMAVRYLVQQQFPPEGVNTHRSKSSSTAYLVANSLKSLVPTEYNALSYGSVTRTAAQGFILAREA